MTNNRDEHFGLMPQRANLDDNMDGDGQSGFVPVSNVNGRPTPRRNRKSCSICNLTRPTLIILILLFIVLLLAVCITIYLTGDFSDKKKSSNCAHLLWNDRLLPKVATANHYSVRIHPNMTSLSFSGLVTINLQILENTDYIVLHSHNMTIHSHSLIGCSDCALRLEQCAAHQQLIVQLDREYAVDEELRLHLTFGGELRGNLVGLYLNTVTDLYGNEWLAGGIDYCQVFGIALHLSSKQPKKTVRKSAVTQFEPIEARRMLPCLDEPVHKAVFELSVVRASEHTAYSNMPLKDTHTHPQDANWKVDKFYPSPKMSTYLLALAVGDFEIISKKAKSGVQVSVIAPPHQIGEAEYSLGVGVIGLDFFEDYFNISYPLPKLDMVALDDFSAGAMENWGLMTFRDTLLLCEQKRITSYSLEQLVTVIMHEIAHQWFGNLVTMKWWDEIWLNEGFATYMEYISTDELFPDWHFMDVFYLDVVSLGLHVDALKNTHAVANPISAHPAQIGSVFDFIAYQKSASIIGMLQSLIGKEHFRSALQDYLTKYQYSNPASRDLWVTIEKYTGKLGELSLEQVAVAWTRNVGCPLVRVQLKDNQVTLSQTRYVYLNDSTPTYDGHQPQTDDEVWPIPVAYVTNRDPTTVKHAWLTHKELSMGLDGPIDWLIANSGGNGFYRVLYDVQAYEKFAKLLKKDFKNVLSLAQYNFLMTQMFDDSQRTALLSDVASLLRSAHLPVSVVFDVFDYLRVSGDVADTVWRTVTSSLANMNLWLQSTPVLPLFREYVRVLLTDVYNHYSWEPSSEHAVRRVQSTILTTACYFDLPDCIDKALGLFNRWKLGETIAPDQLGAVIDAGIRHGNRTDWQLVYAAFLREELPSTKILYLEALCLSSDTWTLQQLLDKVLVGNEIKAVLITNVAASMASNPNGKQLAWRFLRQKWDTIQAQVGETALIGRWVGKTLEHFASQDDLLEAEKFFAGRQLALSERKVMQTLELMRINVRWVHRNTQPLHDWLQTWKLNGPFKT